MSNALTFLGRDMAVDLGTANTLVYVRGRGIVLNEPSVVALNTNNGQIVAVGVEAKRMIGRTPGNIVAVRPLKDGVIADFDVTERMLRYFIQKVHRRTHMAKPRLVVAVPSGITGVEQSAVKEAGHQAGARRVYIIEEPMAAAIGAGLPVGEPVGSLVVDIGGGTTEIAVTALGSLAVMHSIKVGGYQMDDAIVRSIQQRERLLIGQEQAEALKIQIGTATEGAGPEPRADVAGRDLATGLLRRVEVTAEQVRSALGRPLEQIVAATKDVLEQTPAELSADLIEGGVTLVGGGALLPRLDDLLRTETRLPVTIADSPLTTVALGAGQALEELGALKSRRRRKRRRRSPP